jgi:Protein of unknown function (DUF3105)
MGQGEQDRGGLGQRPGSADRRSQGKRRLIIASAAVLTALAVLLFLLLDNGGDDAGSNLAHINPDASAGSTNGVAPDERGGIPPPPPHQTSLKKAAEEAGCFARLDIHYKTNPPSSGPITDSARLQADGAYRETPARNDLLRSLGRGRLEIQYALDLSEKIQRRLKGLYDTMYGGALLFPNYEVTEWAVAATTWTNFLGCPGWAGAKTIDAIRAFGKATWGRYGGEHAFAMKVTGPTPAQPAEPATKE